MSHVAGDLDHISHQPILDPLAAAAADTEAAPAAFLVPAQKGEMQRTTTYGAFVYVTVIVVLCVDDGH